MGASWHIYIAPFFSGLEKMVRGEYFVTSPLGSKLSAESNNFKIGPETKKLSVLHVVNFRQMPAKIFTPVYSTVVPYY